MTRIAQVAKFVAKAGHGAKVVEALEQAYVAAEAEPGTLVYTIHIAPESEDIVWMYELYEDSDAQVNHSSSTATALLRATVKDLLDEPLVVIKGSVHKALSPKL
jgi:quinol monooxygenase YgiN